MNTIPVRDLYMHVVRHSLSKHEADSGYHANRAADAQERAVIFLRLLAGESKWSDGYERRVDDCFENNDGDAVVGWLLEWSAACPKIRALITLHRTVGLECFATWQANPRYRNAHRKDELPLGEEISTNSLTAG